MIHSGELATLLTDFAVLAGELNLPKAAQRFEHLRDHYRAGDWCVLLLGQTSSGKTTWANSLLGKPMLPVGPGTSSVVPVELRFAECGSPLWEALDSDGRVNPLTAVEFAARSRQPGTIRRIRVTWPIRWLPVQA